LSQECEDLKKIWAEKNGEPISLAEFLDILLVLDKKPATKDLDTALERLESEVFHAQCNDMACSHLLRKRSLPCKRLCALM